MRAATLTSGKKKIRREKIRFGQAPQNALPPGQNETATAGADQGPGATSSVLPSTTVPDGTAGETSNIAAADVDPLAPVAPVTKKTRFSDRAAEESVRKAQDKAVKVKQKQLAVPVQQTAVERTTSDVQNSALGLQGDTATKKKKKKGQGRSQGTVAEPGSCATGSQARRHPDSVAHGPPERRTHR